MAWTAFALIALLPLAQLAWDALAADGGWDPTGLSEQLLTADPWRLLADSLCVAGGASALAVAIGVPLAFLIERSDLPGRRLLGVLCLIPLLIPPQIHAIVWARLLALSGPVNPVLQELLGLESAPLSPFGIGGVVFVLGLAYFPFVTLLTGAGLRSIAPGLESAALLRQGPRRVLIAITLPLVAPQILTGAILVFVFAILDFGVPDILRVRVYAVEVFIQLSALYDQQAAILMSLPLLVVTLLLVGLQARMMRGRAYLSLSLGVAGTHRYALGKAKPVAVVASLLVVGLAVLVPVGALASLGGPGVLDMNTLAPALTAILTSLGVAVVTAAVATGLALLIAQALPRAASGADRGARLDQLTQLPVAVPPILVGIALIGLWNRPATGWLYDSLAILVLGNLARFLPFAIRMIHAGLRQIDPALEEAAWLASPRRSRIIGRIILPLSRRALAASFLILLVLTMGELSLTLLVVPPGVETLPVRIYNLMHYGAEEAVAALSLILLAVQLGLCLLVLIAVGWTRGERA